MNQKALTKYFNATVAQPACLGRLDCVRFVAEALKAGWGIDHLDVLRYSDRRTAVKRLRELGGLENAVSSVLGEPVNPADLRPGDVAYFLEPSIGLVMPGYVAVKFRQTIVRVPLQFAARGWWTWVRS